jgi:hypothetical protein
MSHLVSTIDHTVHLVFPRDRRYHQQDVNIAERLCIILSTEALLLQNLHYNQEESIIISKSDINVKEEKSTDNRSGNMINTEKYLRLQKRHYACFTKRRGIAVYRQTSIKEALLSRLVLSAERHYIPSTEEALS